MPTPYAYVGILGGVVALGFLIYSIFTSGPEPERGYQNRANDQSKTNYESGYDRPRDADWGENDEIPNSSTRRRRAQKPECPICTEAQENEVTTKLKCSHIFHRRCILEWFKSARDNGYVHACPVCRAEI